MHFIHIFRFLIKYKGRGKYVPLVFLISIILIAGINLIVNSLFSFTHDRYEVRLLFASSLFLAGIINSRLDKHFALSAEGQKEETGQEHSYIYIPVSAWTTIFMVGAMIMILATIANAYKLG